MFAKLVKLSLLSLVLPINALAGSHGNLLNRHHDIAKRQPGNVAPFDRRISGARWSFYNVETGNAGSCGQFHTNADFTVAMNAAQMQDSYCFKTITMTYNGKTTTASVTDTCPGCPYGGLDLTEGLFQYFAPASVGIIYGTWDFTDAAPAPAPTTTKKTTTSVWVAPTSTWVAPTTSKWVAPTSTWVAPSSTSSSTKTSSKPKSTSTSTWSSTSTSTSTSKTSTSTTSTSATSSINYLTGPASGLAIPTATIVSPSGSPENIADLYQAFVQVGGLIAGAAAA
ncbi:hypothetical protein HYPSUDRAFT_43400 [Hypholoma sublateritium FD-334 SS-4]|uniref:RlpA-like protein double-psi beta-barrel domain-containing protein n=1 Tax=Hypholoma sublateritium (strain FD-334 SS-4) TaxID=945553 RepID=A0A0D2NN66_HYPSF|nr:hypothetical protein HYPSUDRAFT_43400 [Hypholoma sublateritium FD-334 SS-4]